MLCVDTLGSDLMAASRLSATCCGAASGPVHSGPVLMVASGGPAMRVRLSVYDTGFDRYAVVAPDKVYCKACGFINLKNTTATKLSATSFQLVSRDCEGSSLTFTVSSPRDLDPWLDTLAESEDSSMGVLSGSPPKVLGSSPPRTVHMRPSSSGARGRRSSRLSLPSLREESLSEGCEEE